MTRSFDKLISNSLILKSFSAILISSCLISNLAAQSVLIPIKSGNDDAEEHMDGSMNLNSSDLELAADNDIRNLSSSNQTIGLRFTNVPIPEGAQITNAYVQFRVDEVSSGESPLTIAGEAVSNAASFSASSANISSRTLTANQVSWSPPDWPTVGSLGTDRQTPDLSAVLQEIIDNNDWASGQAMALIIKGSGRRVAESFEGDKDSAATLHIQFSDPSVNNARQQERLKVAFIGDQGVYEGARSVLSLIKDEDTDLLLIQGDLGYDDNTAQQWETNLNEILGYNFPVLTVVGNHEEFEWDRYQSFISNRINRVPSLSNCTGNLGVKSFCQFQNLDIVQVSPGISHTGINPEDGYPEYITQSFNSVSASEGNRWRICSWHKNQTAMQTGNKTNDTGWDVYNACLQVGAMIATGHEHAYSRTHLLDNFETQSIAHTDSVMTLKPGNAFAFVSGLGGKEVRPQYRDGDWWGSVYSSTQGAAHGALFCEFGNTQADCYFKDIEGSVADRFTLKLPQDTGNPANSPYPEGNPDTATARSGNTITIDVLANDTGNNLVLMAPNQWSLKAGRVALFDNKLSYTPNSAFNGEDKIWYIFKDEQGRSNWSEVTINVSGGFNPFPVGKPDTATVRSGRRITIDVLANDVGNGRVLIAPNQWSLRGGRVTMSDNKLSYTSGSGFNGQDKIWYIFEEFEGRSNWAEVTINVMP